MAALVAERLTWEIVLVCCGWGMRRWSPEDVASMEAVGTAAFARPKQSVDGSYLVERPVVFCLGVGR